MSVSNYHNYLKRSAAINGLQLKYTPAAIINGSVTPPPSRMYPGTKCYMVTVYIGEDRFHGFGPTPFIARTAAEYEAYKVLCITSSEVDNTVENKDQTSSDAVYQNPDVDYNYIHRQDTDIHDQKSDERCSVIRGYNFEACSQSTVSTLPFSQLAEDVPVSNSNCNNNEKDDEPFKLYTVSDSDEDTQLQRTTQKDIGPELSQQFLTSHEPGTHYSQRMTTSSSTSRNRPLHDVTKTSSRFSQRSRFKYYTVPKTYDEVMAALTKNSQDTDSGEEYKSFNFCSGKKNGIEDELLRVAAQKGLLVSFELSTYNKGTRYISQAIAGRHKCTATHFKKRVAKLLSAKKLLEILVKLPDVIKPSLNSQPCVSMPPCLPPSPSHSQHDLSADISHHFENPIDQLHKLMMKRKLTLPIYSISPYVNGLFQYFLCTVTADQRSALGMGSTKKEARKVAAANLLLLFETKGENIDPCKVKKKKHHSSKGYLSTHRKSCSVTHPQTFSQPLKNVKHDTLISQSNEDERTSHSIQPLVFGDDISRVRGRGRGKGLKTRRVEGVGRTREGWKGLNMAKNREIAKTKAVSLTEEVPDTETICNVSLTEEVPSAETVHNVSLNEDLVDIHTLYNVSFSEEVPSTETVHNVPLTEEVPSTETVHDVPLTEEGTSTETVHNAPLSEEVPNTETAPLNEEVPSTETVHNVSLNEEVPSTETVHNAPLTEEVADMKNVPLTGDVVDTKTVLSIREVVDTETVPSDCVTENDYITDSVKDHFEENCSQVSSSSPIVINTLSTSLGSLQMDETPHFVNELVTSVRHTDVSTKSRGINNQWFDLSILFSRLLSETSKIGEKENEDISGRRDSLRKLYDNDNKNLDNRDLEKREDDEEDNYKVVPFSFTEEGVVGLPSEGEF